MMSYLSPSAFRVIFMWVPHEIGGHSGDPYVGMRLTIRWQRYLEEHLKLSRDVECLSIQYDSDRRNGIGVFRLNVNNPVPKEWMLPGEVVEFVNGFRVLAVGKLLAGAQGGRDS
jgi:hypothetical protein